MTALAFHELASGASVLITCCAIGRWLTWIKLRATSRKVSNTSSPFAEQPEKKMTRTVMMQKPVKICGRDALTE